MPVTDLALATSIPPGMRRPGPGGQDSGPAWRAACMESWCAPGWRVVSLNPAEEREALGNLPEGIEVRAAGPGVEDAYGRPGAWVDEAVAAALATGAPVVGLINADILLALDARRRDALLARAARAMLVCNRMEIGHAAQTEGPFYRYGYDLVLMPRRIAARLDLAGFAFGHPWWDYWIVLDALLQGLPVEVVQCDGIRHLSHVQAWNRPGWQRALAVLMGHLGSRRAAFAALAPGEVALAAADFLGAIAARRGDGYGIEEMMVTAGTRFGIEVVRLAERNAWRLD